MLAFFSSTVASSPFQRPSLFDRCFRTSANKVLTQSSVLALMILLLATNTCRGSKSYCSCRVVTRLGSGTCTKESKSEASRGCRPQAKSTPNGCRVCSFGHKLTVDLPLLADLHIDEFCILVHMSFFAVASAVIFTWAMYDGVMASRFLWRSAA